jgi:hypothetical protein
MAEDAQPGPARAKATPVGMPALYTPNISPPFRRNIAVSSSRC